MGFIRFRFTLLGRKLILKLKGRFLEEKMDLIKSRPGRVQILSDPVLGIGILFLCLYHMLSESRFRGNIPSNP